MQIAPSKNSRRASLGSEASEAKLPSVAPPRPVMQASVPLLARLSVRKGAWKGAMGISVDAWTVSGAIGPLIGVIVPPAWRQRIGAANSQRSQAVWLMTCRSCLEPAATLARSHARRPRSRSCGRRRAGMGRVVPVAYPVCYPAALAGRPKAERHRGVCGPLRCSWHGLRWQRAHSGGCDGSPCATRAAGSA
jgi:hypothetical protein